MRVRSGGFGVSGLVLSQRREVRTVDLQPGDRVELPLGHVRTVSSVTRAGYVNGRGQEILTVWYAEGWTLEWSEGNTGAPDTLWTVLR